MRLRLKPGSIEPTERRTRSRSLPLTARPDVASGCGIGLLLADVRELMGKLPEIVLREACRRDDGDRAQVRKLLPTSFEQGQRFRRVPHCLRQVSAQRCASVQPLFCMRRTMCTEVFLQPAGTGAA